jgi:DNA-binding NarL/FixJ family response regulator
MKRLRPRPSELVASPGEGRALSRVEKALLKQLRRGADNAMIAKAVGRRPGTVRNLTTQLLQKLGVRSRAVLIANLNGGGSSSPFDLPPTQQPMDKKMPAATAPFAPRRLASNKKKRQHPLPNPWPAISDAEHHVAVELTRGLSNKEIAIRLGKRDATIKNQLRSIFRRTGYSTRTKLIVALLANSASGAARSQELAVLESASARTGSAAIPLQEVYMSGAG